MSSSRHQWGEPQRFAFSTTRTCVRCGLVKVTRHEPGLVPWQEFVRDCERIPGKATPPCAGAADDAGVEAVDVFLADNRRLAEDGEEARE